MSVAVAQRLTRLLTVFSRRSRAQEAYTKRDGVASAVVHEQRQPMERFHQEKRLWSTIYSRTAVNAASLGCSICTISLFIRIPFMTRYGTSTSLVIGLLSFFVALATSVWLYLQTTSFARFKEGEREREEWECENYLQGEKKEMVELYETKGLSRSDATTVVDLISRDKKLFVDIMMVEELGFSNDPEEDKLNHLLNAVTHLCTCFIGGLLPLVTCSIAGACGTVLPTLVSCSVVTSIIGFMRGVLVPGVPSAVASAVLHCVIADAVGLTAYIAALLLV